MYTLYKIVNGAETVLAYCDDPMECAQAIRVVEAEEQLRQALAWDDVFTRMDRIYPAGCLEDTVSRMLYDKGFNQATVGEALGMHRITVRRYQDRYVINLALLAVQEGLARMEEKADGTA